MVACSHCGRDVTGKKFCPDCGAAVSHCPACQASVAVGSAFCTECGHDMRVTANATNTVRTNLSCPQCGKQNAPDMRFCGGCGYHLMGAVSSPSDPYASSTPNYQQQQGASYQYPQGSNYNQPPYPQQQGYQQQQSYPQQQYMQQGGYQPQPMMGQQPMVLRCPTCMAMAPVGSASCPGCRTSLAGVLPTPAGMQGQQQGGFLQGNNGKLAMGVLGGAAAVLGGEMLLHGVENGIENRVEGDMGYGGRHHHHRRDDDRGPLGGLGELADDLGLF